MKQVNTKNLLLGIFVILLPMISISTSVYLFLENRDVKGITVKNESPDMLVPYISNIPPNVAYVGEEYLFIPKVVSEESSVIKLILVESPSWIYIDENNILRGIPQQKDLGSEKLVLKVSDGYNSSTLTEYLIVQ